VCSAVLAGSIVASNRGDWRCDSTATPCSLLLPDSAVAALGGAYLLVPTSGCQ
jgi:hypothetical protein